ncbi:MAG TPA: lysylphosphatidylglycerol synthase transmembrane domain-containing protein [Chthoniobacterales bacterium]|nr:lysylphosphatidylglycerol synthase transmembrane domain-containing protein [Chthoniobacterales bacterium]
MKKILITLLQLSVTIALLWWVFHDPEQRDKMGKALRAADYRWVAAAICAYVTVEVAAGIRWQILLRVQGIRLNFFRLSALFLIGMFYNQFLPGGTGGDIIKSYLLLKETAQYKAGALLAVVFDRLIGLVALVTITVTLVALRFDLLWRTPVTVESGFTPRQLLIVLGVLLSVSITGLLVSFIVSGFNLFHLLPHRFPGRDKLIEISAAYHLYAHHWLATLFAFGASLVAHLATFTTFLFVAYALHAEDVRKQPPMPVPAVDFFAVMPIERTITAIPISLAGIGLREKLLQVMLNNLCGITVEKSKLIGSLGFLVIIICCAPGGIVYFFYKPSGAAGHVKLREMQREVATLEHEIGEGK